MHQYGMLGHQACSAQWFKVSSGLHSPLRKILYYISDTLPRDISQFTGFIHCIFIREMESPEKFMKPVHRWHINQQTSIPYKEVGGGHGGVDRITMLYTPPYRFLRTADWFSWKMICHATERHHNAILPNFLQSGIAKQHMCKVGMKLASLIAGSSNEVSWWILE